MEGPQAVREALDTPDQADQICRELFVTEAAQQRNDGLLQVAEGLGVRISPATDRAVAGLAGTNHPQGIVGVCSTIDVPLAEALTPPVGLACILAEVRDPGNAGAVLRCADAAGAGAVVFAGDSVDPYNGKCVRASAGSIFHVPLACRVSVSEAIEHSRAQGLTVFAAIPNGDADLDELSDAGELAGPTAWMFGNEAWGIPNSIAVQADRTVRIPIYGRAESLNLATASAICLYTSARAQRAAAQ